MTLALAVDLGLALLILGMAGWTIAVRDTFASVIGLVAYGLLLALAFPLASGLAIWIAPISDSLKAAVAAGLDLREPPVAALGGGLLHLAGLRHRFERGLRRRGGILVAPRGDACHGALQLAAALLQPDPDVNAAEAVAF